MKHQNIKSLKGRHKCVEYWHCYETDQIPRSQGEYWLHTGLYTQLWSSIFQPHTIEISLNISKYPSEVSEYSKYQYWLHTGLQPLYTRQEEEFQCFLAPSNTKSLQFKCLNIPNINIYAHTEQDLAFSSPFYQ